MPKRPRPASCALTPDGPLERPGLLAARDHLVQHLCDVHNPPRTGGELAGRCGLAVGCRGCIPCPGRCPDRAITCSVRASSLVWCTNQGATMKGQQEVTPTKYAPGSAAFRRSEIPTGFASRTRPHRAQLAGLRRVPGERSSVPVGFRPKMIGCLVEAKKGGRFRPLTPLSNRHG